MSLEILPAAATDRDRVVALWHRCGLVVSHNPPEADLDLARGKPGSDVLIGLFDGALVAAVMVGHDGHRGWVYYLAVDPDHQSRGYGRAMVEAAEDWLRSHGIRKVQLMVRASNTHVGAFYDALGYERSDVQVFQRWLDRDGPTS